MPPPVTRAELNEIYCKEPGCNCPGHPSPSRMEFIAKCHQTSALLAHYSREDGTIAFRCSVCRTVIVKVLVAGALPS